MSKTEDFISELEHEIFIKGADAAYSWILKNQPHLIPGAALGMGIAKVGNTIGGLLGLR